MSRIGKKPILLPKGVSCTLADRTLSAKGPKGESSLTLPVGVSAEVTQDAVILKPQGSAEEERAYWGLARSLVQNLIHGVYEGFKKVLELEGVGYRASVHGSTLNFQLGFSHDVHVEIPEGVFAKCDKPTQITLESKDKQILGQIIARLQKLRPPEPYKGKGIHEAGKPRRRKEGKKK
jgi:large subunit ribosomal protein L6